MNRHLALTLDRFATIPLAIGLLAVGAWLLVRAFTNQAPVEVVTKCDLGSVASGSHPVSFSLHNTSSKPVRLLGASWHCLPGGCAPIPSELPCTLLPGEQRELTTVLVKNNPGPIDYAFTVFTDAPDQPTIDLSIQGVATPK